MGNVKIRHYPFDFHTHFWGILPVHPVPGASIYAPSIEQAIRQFYKACDETLLSLDVKRRIFALGLLEAFKLFSKWIGDTLPPSEPTSFQVNSYVRGECFVENALIGWNLIAQKTQGDILPEFWSNDDSAKDALSKIETALKKIEKNIMGKKLSSLSPAEKTGFETELERLIKSGVLSVLGAEQITEVLNDPSATMGELANTSKIYLGSRFYSIKFLKPQASIFRYYDYFNNLMLSANEFTPFDDAYVARDSVKDLRINPGDGDVYSQTYLIDETNKYYENEGISHTQLSMSRKDRGPIFERFNIPPGDENSWGVNNKILYHNTNHNIGSDPGELYSFLNQAVADFNKNETDFQKRVIGVDFLGSETHVDFETLFQVFEKFKDEIEAPAGKETFTLRIHVGEGSGASSDNRSVLGQMCADGSVASALAENGPYANFVDRLSNFRPGAARGGQLSSWPDTLDLAQKIFSGQFYTLRFNIFSDKTHDRVSAIAESNMLALYHAATKVNSRGRYIYGPRSVFNKTSIRLGHGQHARQYIHALSQMRGLASGFRTIAFDTNLGSNYITGSSSNIMSPEDFNRAEGIRTLTSFAPARYVIQAINAVFGKTALSDTLFRNAFPLLVGSDGQGVEHTNLERENVRGLVLFVLRSALMNQFMTDKDCLEQGNLESLGFLETDSGTDAVVSFMFDDALAYWQRTVGDAGDIAEQSISVSGGAWVSEQRIEPIKSGFAGFEYYKAPEFDIRWNKQVR
ncbi:hypothetical protein [Thalassovita aquimarina]|uniref:Uncharacterized protein n=1 Tax=Thalassovita aquimarina TaxID=2785917 RepID=A0ABS5HWU3_9RHOB|nr:hypothetical protein [Thalassovita aquimarina]MBR9653427.1 hypothetical protein [Thalassovita aquimarina]